MGAEKSGSENIHAKQIDAVNKTKYFIDLLSKLGVSRDKRSVEARKALWDNCKEDIKKEDKDVKDVYSGSLQQNELLLKYMRTQIKDGKIFDANALNFKSGLEKETVKGKGAAERDSLRGEIEGKRTEGRRWEKLKESGEKRDDAYTESMKKDIRLFDGDKRNPEEIRADLDRKVTMDDEVYEQWKKSTDNSNWININAKGRDEAYQSLSEMQFGLDDFKKVMNGKELSMDSVAKKAGYKSSAEMAKLYDGYRWDFNVYLSGARLYVQNAEKLEIRKNYTEKDMTPDAWKGLQKEIAELETIMAMQKKEIEEGRPKIEKARPHFERLMRIMNGGKKLIQVVGDKEKFFYNKQEDLAETEDALSPENQKTLGILNSVFEKNSKGPAIEDSKKVVTMLDLSQDALTKDTSHFERTSSYGAAYDDVESRVLDTKNSDNTRVSLGTKFNHYIELALIKTGKSDQLSKYQVNEDMMKSGEISEDAKALIRVGYIVDLHNTYAIEKARRMEVAKEYSKNPQVVELLNQFKSKNPNITDTELRRMGRKIDSQLAAGVMIGATRDANGNLAPTGAFGMSFDVGDGVSFSVGIGGSMESGPTGALGAHKKIQITKDTKITFSLGVSGNPGSGNGTPGIGVGAGAVVETKISKDWDGVFGASVGVDAIRLQVGAGGVIGVHKNIERVYENDVNDKYEKAGIAGIEKAENQYEALLAHPVIGKQIAETLAVVDRDMSARGEKLSEEYKQTIAFEIYDTIKNDIEAQAIENLDPGLITGGGLMISTSIMPVMPYVTINLGKKVRVLRLLDAASQDVSDEELFKQLNDELSGNPDKEFVDLGKSGKMAMDKQGRNTVTMDKTVKFNTKGGGNLEVMNEAISKARVRFEQNGDGLLKMNIEGSRNANINIHLDPELTNAQLIHDAKDFFLNYDFRQDLLITRKDVRYPYMKDGAYREISIYIKKDAVSEKTLEKTESAMLEKNVGKAIKESGTKGKLDGNNILDYQTFLQMQKEGKIDKFEIPSEKAFKDAVDKLLATPEIKDSIDGRELPVRRNLGKLTEGFYKSLNASQKARLKQMTTEFNAGLAVDYGSILDDFEKYIGKKKELPLSSLERNYFRNALITSTFRDVRKLGPEGRKKLFEHDRKWIEDTFKGWLDSVPQTESKERNDYLKDKAIEIIMGHLEKSTFEKSEWVDIDPATHGDQLVTMVGTQHIVGGRRSTDYDGERFKLINPIEFNNKSGLAEYTATAGMLLDIASPIDTSSPEKLMRSPLALKLAKIVPFAFKPEDVDSYISIMKGANPDSDPKLSAFYKKFVELVKKVREAEKKDDANGIDLGPDYGNVQIKFDISTSVSLIERCQNLTVMGKEDLQFTVESPVFGGASGETHARVDSRLTAKFRELGLAFGFVPTGVTERKIEQGGGGGERPRPAVSTRHTGTVDTGAATEKQDNSQSSGSVAGDQGAQSTEGI